MSTMMPGHRRVATGSAAPHPINVRPLAYALGCMEPELRALILPGESWDDMVARRQAAADILDDLLREYEAEAVSA